MPPQAGPVSGAAAGAEARATARPRYRSLAILGGLTVFALALFAAFWLIDYFLIDAGAAHRKDGPVGQLFDYDAQTMQNALGSLSQVIASVLGIAITVVSIVVQLAATRYTPRVADLFFRDRINIGVMGFFVVACVESVWVSFVVRADYVPQATVTLTVVMSSASLLLLVPYFAYVFDFLDPEKVIARIGQQTLDRATTRQEPSKGSLNLPRRLRWAKPSSVNASANAGARRRSFTDRQAQAVSGLAHLADIAVNAMGQKDKVIASDASAALRRLLVDYQTRKERLEPEWFAIGAPLQADPDFVALADDSLQELARNRTWLEWKGLRQVREVFGAALSSVPEMAHVVTIDTRYVGEAALAAGNRDVFAMVVKFMNTYLRAALNARDVRTAYNVLNQYRQLAEALLAAPRDADRWSSTTLVEVAAHFKYYARLAHGNGLGFVTETAAYDLCALCEAASAHQSDCQDRLLQIFLQIDDAPETPDEERALRGVRKAQAKLATYYLSAGESARAQAIFDDMAAESPERLRSIRDEMLAVTAKDFWEVVDRGANFDYLPAPRKDHLRAFFSRFPSLS
ncbi:MAG TPA: DUF2254 family protein [Polyangia bacterium]|nr:DUF2254 family protein [Polyangia bacterium]